MLYPADIYVRYQRAQKRDIQSSAKRRTRRAHHHPRMKEGITPTGGRKYHALSKELEQMNISFDIYSVPPTRTHETASAFFKKL